MLAGWSARRTPAFARCALPALARRGRRALDARRHRAQDGVDLDARTVDLGRDLARTAQT
jgi:hypothetical protein